MPVVKQAVESRSLISAERYQELGSRSFTDRFDTLLSIFSFLAGVIGLLLLIKVMN